MNFCPHCGKSLTLAYLPGPNTNATATVQPTTVWLPNTTATALDTATQAGLLAGGGAASATGAGRVLADGSPLVQPIREIRREDLPDDVFGDAAWQARKAQEAATHREKRLAHARLAWDAVPDHVSSATVADDILLAWFERSAHEDGAANATALKAWRAAHPNETRTPSDPELVEWLRAEREKRA